MVRAGLDAAEVLRAATSAAADLLRLRDRGRIAPGLRADLVGAPGDLSRGLDGLARPSWVLRGGAPAPGSEGPARRFREAARTKAALVRGYGRVYVDAVRPRG